MTAATTTATATNDESAEDIEAKNLLNEWAKELEETDEESAGAIDDDPLDYDEDLEKYRRPDLDKSQDNVLDHIVLASSDLDKAMDLFEKMTGLKPVMVCSLNGLGTKSARVAFTECCFLEIVAPDPKQEPSSPLADKLKDVCPSDGSMIPLHYSVRHSKALSELKDTRFKELGYESVDQVTMVAKDRSMPWKWDMIFLEGHDDGGLVPYYANWSDSHIHAAARLPIVGDYPRVKVSAPSSHKVHELLDTTLSIHLEESDETSVEFSFDSKNGEHITFKGSDLVGISFPKGD